MTAKRELSKCKNEVKKSTLIKIKKMTFEEALSHVEKIVSELDRGEISLEESLLKYREAMQVLKHASGLLDEVKEELKLIDESNETVRLRDYFIRHDFSGD
ncbi:MAG: exodeoxyribonuclease VII small subunit [Betaproteobacteria bacterium TMED82]|nr:MAG: exodeoxyribonuclease VII small subunit [Betaproteobacteria bacterium TMED82]